MGLVVGAIAITAVLDNITLLCCLYHYKQVSYTYNFDNVMAFYLVKVICLFALLTLVIVIPSIATLGFVISVIILCITIVIDTVIIIRLWIQI